MLNSRENYKFHRAINLHLAHYIRGVLNPAYYESKTHYRLVIVEHRLSNGKNSLPEN